MKCRQWLLALILPITLLNSCVTSPAPNLEYTLAKVALDEARAAGGLRYSAGPFHQAEDFFNKGKVAYEDRDYAQAKSAFVRSRKLAEKSENAARLIKAKNGEVF